jgi:hypothetical protein
MDTLQEGAFTVVEGLAHVVMVGTSVVVSLHVRWHIVGVTNELGGRDMDQTTMDIALNVLTHLDERETESTTETVRDIEEGSLAFLGLLGTGTTAHVSMMRFLVSGFDALFLNAMRGTKPGCARELVLKFLIGFDESSYTVLFVSGMASMYSVSVDIVAI